MTLPAEPGAVFSPKSSVLGLQSSVFSFRSSGFSSVAWLTTEE